ncbi:MAG: hypothetical protein ACXV98_06625 [Ilumatobacteraceae bacterium]
MSNSTPGDRVTSWQMATRAKIVRAAANSDPLTRCALCGELARAWDPWVAGRGDHGSLIAEHRSCSSSAGAKSLYRRRHDVEEAAARSGYVPKADV